MGRLGREREAFPVAGGITNGSIAMTHAHAIQDRAPLLLGRTAAKPGHVLDQTGHGLLEDALIKLLRQHCPPYFKTDGYAVRCAFSRAFVRFVLERTRGNQVRAAVIAGINRNTLRKLIRSFAVDWKTFLAK